MPHRVTSFLRTSSNNIHIKSKKSGRSRSGTPSRANTPDVSDHEDNNVHHILPDLADAVLKKRLSLPFGSKQRENDHSATLVLDWRVESPPIILHGPADESTGALLSGQVVIEIKEDEIEVPCLHAKLELTSHHKRPFQHHCEECADQVTEIKTWHLIPRLTTLRRGTHNFPFSVLLDGNLPPSMNTSAMSSTYIFRAEATVTRSSAPAPFVTNFSSPVTVKRSIPVPDVPHHSVRVFPPTNIKTSVLYLPVIHPSGSNRVTLKMDGLKTLNEKTKTLDLWKLKKVTWRLEETVRTVAPACDRHLINMTADEEPRGGALRVEKRLLGEKHIHEGWKSDFTGKDGYVDMEFDYGVHIRSNNKRDLKYAIDHKGEDGTQVTHSLLVEMVVSKEYAPEGKPHMAAQTGTGRILRMHFGVVLTEHSGLGVSWDNEAPPVYQDVPPSPPAYPKEEGPIEYEELMLELVEARRRASIAESGSSTPGISRRNSSSSAEGA